jgi:hypothetical protein
MIFFLAYYYILSEMGNTNKRKGIGDKIKHFFKDTIGGGLKKAWNWVMSTVKGIVTIVHDNVKGVVSTLCSTRSGTTET